MAVASTSVSWPVGDIPLTLPAQSRGVPSRGHTVRPDCNLIASHPLTIRGRRASSTTGRHSRQGGSVKPPPTIGKQPIENQSHQRLDSGDQDLPLFEAVLGLEIERWVSRRTPVGRSPDDCTITKHAFGRGTLGSGGCFF